MSPWNGIQVKIHLQITAIGLLEAELGVELFDRSRRNAVLTEAGKVMHLEACELLRQAERLQLRA